MQLYNINSSMSSDALILQHPASGIHLNRKRVKPNKIALTTLAGVHYVETEQVSYCQAEGNYCNIFLTNGERILVSKTLKWVSSLLPEHEFIRAHKSYLVRVKEVKTFSFNSVLLLNGSRIPVSRSNRKEVRKKLEQ